MWSRNTQETQDLKHIVIGQKVLIQNQHGAGKIAKKGDRTGQVAVVGCLIITDSSLEKSHLSLEQAPAGHDSDSLL